MRVFLTDMILLINMYRRYINRRYMHAFTYINKAGICIDRNNYKLSLLSLTGKTFECNFDLAKHF